MSFCSEVSRTLKAISVATLISISSIGGLQAQEISSEHLKAAKSVISAIGITGRLDNILPQIAEEAKASLISTNPNLVDQISVIVDESAIELAGRRGDLEDEVGRIYAANFSEAELAEIATFYESDSGKKLLKLTPQTTRLIDRAAQVWTVGLGRDLKAKIGEKMKAQGLQ